MTRTKNYRLEETSRGKYLVVTGSWNQETADRAHADDVHGLVLNYALGFQETSIDFLRDLNVESVEILARTIRDLTPLESLSETLVNLSVVTEPSESIHLEAFPHLQELAAEWSQIKASISAGSSLVSLYAGSYTESDLRPLSALSSLEDLQMKDNPRVKSLQGVEDLPWLVRLGIFGARSLLDLDALESPILRELELTGWSAPLNSRALERLRGLKHLDLSEGRDLDSLTFIRGTPDLQSLYLYGTTNVVDADLSPLLSLSRLSDLRMRNRRAYRPSLETVRDALKLEG
jgi:hypothetical protein